MKKLNDDLCVVILSCGQDSTTCLAWAVDKYGAENTKSITFNYWQRHLIEIDLSKIISKKFDVGHHIIETDILKKFDDSALVNDEKDISAEKDGLPASFVPGRNNFFLLLTAIFAYKKNIKNIVAGMCQTDFSGYPDCREESIMAVETALNLCMETDFVIHTPLMNLTKSETFKMADELGCLGTILDYTMTCYNGSLVKNEWGVGCGQCPACGLIKKGFNEYSRQKTQVQLWPSHI